MKRLYRILCGIAVCASSIATSSCSKETVYIYPETGITRLTVSPVSVDMGYADEVSFTVAVRPGDTDYVWETSDPSVAYVDENDHIVPVGIGTVEFTCSAGYYSQTITAVIRSSVVMDTDYMYIDQGQQSMMDFVQILPENVSYTVESADETIVSIPDESRLGFSAVGSGVTTVTVTTEDEISRTLTVAVANTDNVITGSAANEYFYDGATLGHPGYGISALALSPSGAEYTDGDTWSGEGTGLFLKLYNPSNGSDYTAISSGTYTQGTGENSFYTDNSYVIDVTSGERTYLTAGELGISDNGVTGYVTAGTSVYKVSYSGSISGRKHVYAYSELNYSFTEEDFSDPGTLYIDHDGTVFYGGYGNAWMWQMSMSNGSDSDYLQIIICSLDTNDPTGTFPVSDGFFVKGTCVGMGWGWTTSFSYEGISGNISNGELTIDNYTYANPASNGFHGTLGGSCSDSIPEIGESRTIPFTLNIDIESLSFTKKEY